MKSILALPRPSSLPEHKVLTPAPAENRDQQRDSS